MAFFAALRFPALFFPTFFALFFAAFFVAFLAAGFFRAVDFFFTGVPSSLASERLGAMSP